MKKYPLMGVCICAILVLTSGIPVSSGYTIVEAPSKNIYHFQSIFHLQFTLIVWWNGSQLTTPILPGEIREINLNLTYGVNKGLWGKLLLRFLEGRSFPIQILLDDKPDWCEAWVLPKNLTGLVPEGERYSSLCIKLNESAPGNYTLGVILLRATIEDMKGPFNIITLIQGFEQQFSLYFQTGP